MKRRVFLISATLIPALCALRGIPALAQGSKTSKAAMHYQTSPNGGMQCSGCRFFIAGQDAKSDGTCQIVDGSISPNGYCMAYAAKDS
jgi:hypothetical protein